MHYEGFNRRLDEWVGKDRMRKLDQDEPDVPKKRARGDRYTQYVRSKKLSCKKKLLFPYNLGRLRFDLIRRSCVSDSLQ